jgi:hypothetical protein
MKNTSKSKLDPRESGAWPLPQRRSYSAPTLVRFGAVRELTRGSVGTDLETTQPKTRP